MNPAEKTDEGKSSRTGRNKRDINNIFVNPRAQLRYAFAFFGGGVGIMCLYIIYFLYDLNRTIESLANTFAISPDVAHDLNRAILVASIALIAFSATLTLVLFTFGIALSHRLFGPIVPIQRLIGQLKAGDYAARGTLRKKDEWQDVMQDLNKLGEELQRRHGSVKKD